MIRCVRGSIRIVLLAGIASTFPSAWIWAQDGPLLTKSPTLSATQIVFVHGGHLWSVPREGGEAKRLTARAESERFPRFSPDGRWIAFSAAYNGILDVYVMPAGGGSPSRLTHHPGLDIAAGWSPDGSRVLFSSPRAGMGDWRLFSAPLDGGFPVELPLPLATEGSLSPDGKMLAYVPLPLVSRVWRNYRGGLTSKIWISTLADSSTVPVPRGNSYDFCPMWIGDSVYFLSDRNGPATLFRYDTRTKRVIQLLKNEGHSIKSASAGPGAIIYDQFGSLHLFDLKTGLSKRVPVVISGELPETQPRSVKVGGRLARPALSPDGGRALFEARGEILAVDAKSGETINMTNSPGTHERDPALSPDGTRVAYFSDEAGEYELHIPGVSGAGEITRIKPRDTPGFFKAPRWSPDGRKIAYIDESLNIWYVDIESGRPVKVDTDYSILCPDFIPERDRELAPVWSPDSQWLAYSKQLPSRMSAVHLYSLRERRSTQVTDGLADARYPAFDKSGRFLYFAASINSGPGMQNDVLNANANETFRVFLAVLSKRDGSPLAAGSGKQSAVSGDGAMTVDAEGIQRRIVPLPLPARRYRGLLAGRPGVVFALESPATATETPRTRAMAVHRLDLEVRMPAVAFESARDFTLSADGSRALYFAGGQWTIEELGGAKSKTALKTADLAVRSNPRLEWRQIYREVWRIYRDFFYDPRLHGLDLKAVERHFEPHLDRLASREDLNSLLREMLGGFEVGHIFVSGGDVPERRRNDVGLLGADFHVENERYRIRRVYRGDIWTSTTRAPLAQPGMAAAEGEYLLAINGKELRSTDNIYAALEGTLGKQVTLRVGPRPEMADSREIGVTPVASEFELRKSDWVLANRRKVDELSRGRVAYIYLPDTGRTSGARSFAQEWFAQAGREAAIIDVRYNGGGQLATDIVEQLLRGRMSVTSPRHGADLDQPQGAIPGPKVMIVNGQAASGGDLLPWYFRRARAGILVGTRTTGAVIGLWEATPSLLDGGALIVPSGLTWNPDGKWDLENIGVAPDLEVEQDPKLVRQGRDPQLEKAIEIVLNELRRKPAPAPKRPQYPGGVSR